MESKGKVTLSCRMLPIEKLVLAKEAEDLNLSLAEYVEALILREHNRLKVKRETPKSKYVELKIVKGNKQEKAYRFFIDYLQKQFPDDNEETILLATLAMAHSSYEDFSHVISLHP